MFTEILKRIDKDINKNYTRIKFETSNKLPTNILINIRNIVLLLGIKEFMQILVGIMNFMKKFKYQILYTR